MAARPKRQGLTIVAAALVAGLDSIGFAVALAALMFSGDLSPGLAMGITAVLACSVIMSLTIGTLSRMRTNIASAQDIGAAVLAVTLMSAVSALDPQARIATAFAIIAASTLATGLLLFTVGALKAGRLVRFFPLEVLAGFMAATGFLLLMGGVAMVARVSADVSGMLSVRSFGQYVLLLPGVLLAGLIYIAMKHHRKPFLLLGILLLSTGLFHLWRLWSGIDMADAASAGWLPDVQAVAGVALPFPALLPAVDWPTVLAAAPTIATVAALSLFAALLNISALEFATGHDLDLDHEMRLAGGANMLVAGVGGPPGFTDLTSTLLMSKFGITMRGAGLCVAAIEFAGLLFAATIAMTVPTFVAGGLILYYGFDLINDWLVATRRTFSGREWGVVLLIVVISVFYSFLLAILAGFLIATILFAYSYANSPVLRQTTDLANLPSTTERSPEQARWLAEAGGSVRIFRLQGFLFFGTSEQVMAQIRSAAREPGGLRAVIIDFARVTYMDSASANAFRRTVALAKSAGFATVFSGLDAGLVATLRRVGVAPDVTGDVTFTPDLDRALEHAEAVLIADAPEETAAQGLAQRYQTSPEEAVALSRLFAEMSREVHAPGSRIIKAGARADAVFFIESGRAVVQRVAHDGSIRRLRTMLPGAIVGDVAYSLRGLRTADVTAETQTVTLSISAEAVARLAKSQPELALLFGSLLNRALAEKVMTANRMTEHAR